ncbi:MAG: ParB/RepB/Spo0J family partition protein [Microthrixaceae bacterium]
MHDTATVAEPSERGGPSGVQEVALDDIRANPYQPRVDFDQQSLEGLAASIAALGVLQPLLVRPAEQGSFHLIAGERRWRAARLAGLSTVPVLIRHGDDQAALEEALVENLHREDLNPLEEAVGIQQLMEEFGLSHADAATRLGRSRPAVTNLLRLLQLPTELQRLVRDGLLSAARPRRAGLPDDPSRTAVAKRAVDEELSVRAVEQLVRSRQELADKVPSGRKRPSATTGAAATMIAAVPAPPRRWISGRRASSSWRSCCRTAWTRRSPWSCPQSAAGSWWTSPTSTTWSVSTGW